VQINNGAFTEQALLCITVAIVSGIFAIAPGAVRWVDALGDRPAVTMLGIALLYQFGAMLTSPPGVYLQVTQDQYETFYFGVAGAAILVGAGLSARPWLGKLRFPLLLVIAFILGRWLIKASPFPHIDVYAFHQTAFRALSQRVDPYAIKMPNIYGTTAWYAAGFATPSEVLVGFLYPPLSLLLAWLGSYFGDYRYAMLAAMVLAAAFMGYSRRGRLGAIVAAVFLFTPRGLFVLEQGWTEPFVVLFMAATVFCAIRFPAALPWALGFLFAVKQYCVFFVPISGLLLGKEWSLRNHAVLLMKAGAVALLVTLPFALWNLRGFLESVVFFQGRQPMRTDALSYVAWRVFGGHQPLPGWVSFAAALVATGLSVWRAPRTPAGFAASGSLVLLVFFAFAKQAFCNYYFMIIGCMCCAMAALSQAAAGRPPLERLAMDSASRLSSRRPNTSGAR
jgi:hypothetical protein